MKAPIVGLSIAVVAFAGSSLYLWQQLHAERERSTQVEQTSRQLSARIAELEKARAQFAQMRGGSNGTVINGAFGAGPPPAAAAATNQDAGPDKRESGWTATMSRERPAAMDKMMRWQIRANQKRMYAGVGEALGLSKERTGQLIDLLVDQQLAHFSSPWSSDPQEAQRRAQEQLRQSEAAIQDFLGPDKAMALQEYQQSLPARQEFEMLLKQLEGNDVTLTPEQNKKLLAVYVEERQRVPVPDYMGITDPNAYQKVYAAWQDDYSNRIAEEARHILESGQLNAFNEVQEWQKEMRSQFSLVNTGNGVVQAGVAMEGAAVSFSAAPMAVADGASVTLVAPPPRNDQKREP